MSIGRKDTRIAFVHADQEVVLIVTQIVDHADPDHGGGPVELDRERLMAGLAAFFRSRNLSTDWDALKQAADADLTIKTSKLTLGSVVLTDAAMSTKLDAGKLTTDLSQFKAFGGNWTGQMIVDAASPVPAVNLAMEGNSVAISSLLGTLAGATRLPQEHFA